MLSKPARTVTSKSGVDRGSDTVSNETNIAKAKKASRSVKASRVLVAVVLIGGCCSRTFIDF